MSWNLWPAAAIDAIALSISWRPSESGFDSHSFLVFEQESPAPSASKLGRRALHAAQQQRPCPPHDFRFALDTPHQHPPSHSLLSSHNGCGLRSFRRSPNSLVEVRYISRRTAASPARSARPRRGFLRTATLASATLALARVNALLHAASLTRRLSRSASPPARHDNQRELRICCRRRQLGCAAI